MSYESESSDEDSNEIESSNGEGSQDRGEGNSPQDNEEQFDVTLPATHSYLAPGGSREVPGRTVLEPGWTGRVPCVTHDGLVYPGQTVPILRTRSQDTAALARAIGTDRLFCLLSPDETGTDLSGYGVLCEVFEAGEADRGDTALTCKARATHRVKLLHAARSPHVLYNDFRFRQMEVRVLPEVRLGDPLWRSRLPGPNPLRGQHPDAVHRLEACVTPWPRFVYDMFDYRRTSRVIRDHFRRLGFNALPEDEVSLSYWAAANLSLSRRDRLALFTLDDATLRLHMAVAHIAYNVLCCLACGSEVSRVESTLLTSTAGPHANYTNLGGYIHDIMTVSEAQNLTLSGPPSEEFSWFPGYSWTVAVCSQCMVHLGWKFEAIHSNLRPGHFYGLRRNVVQPRTGIEPAPAF